MSEQNAAIQAPEGIQDSTAISSSTLTALPSTPLEDRSRKRARGEGAGFGHLTSPGGQVPNVDRHQSLGSGGQSDPGLHQTPATPLPSRQTPPLAMTGPPSAPPLNAMPQPPSDPFRDETGARGLTDDPSAPVETTTATASAQPASHFVLGMLKQSPAPLTPENADVVLSHLKVDKPVLNRTMNQAIGRIADCASFCGFRDWDSLSASAFESWDSLFQGLSRSVTSSKDVDRIAFWSDVSDEIGAEDGFPWFFLIVLQWGFDRLSKQESSDGISTITEVLRAVWPEVVSSKVVRKRPVPGTLADPVLLQDSVYHALTQPFQKLIQLQPHLQEDTSFPLWVKLKLSQNSVKSVYMQQQLEKLRHSMAVVLANRVISAAKGNGFYTSPLAETVIEPGYALRSSVVRDDHPRVVLETGPALVESTRISEAKCVYPCPQCGLMLVSTYPANIGRHLYHSCSGISCAEDSECRKVHDVIWYLTRPGCEIEIEGAVSKIPLVSEVDMTALATFFPDFNGRPPVQLGMFDLLRWMQCPQLFPRKKPFNTAQLNKLRGSKDTVSALSKNLKAVMSFLQDLRPPIMTSASSLNTAMDMRKRAKAEALKQAGLIELSRPVPSGQATIHDLVQSIGVNLRLSTTEGDTEN